MENYDLLFSKSYVDECIDTLRSHIDIIDSDDLEDMIATFTFELWDRGNRNGKTRD